MAKQVFDTREIGHLWYHRSQDSARNAGQNFYFSGDTIYSYGGHFPIAQHVEHKGKSAVLMTMRTYSNTTAKHISIVRQAIPQYATILYVPELRQYADGKSYLDSLLDKVQQACEYIPIAKNKIQRAKRYLHLQECVKRAKAYAEFWGLKCKLPSVTNEEELAELVKQTEASRKRAEAKAKREIAKRDKERLAKWAEAVPHWRANEIDELPYHNLGNCLLRIVGDEVQTSRGASFPIEHAKRALRFVARLLKSGESFQRNGKQIHLGHYQIDSIDADGTIMAGCHVVKRDEVERLIVALEQIELGDMAESISDSVAS